MKTKEKEGADGYIGGIVRFKNGKPVTPEQVRAMAMRGKKDPRPSKSPTNTSSAGSK